MAVTKSASKPPLVSIRLERERVPSLGVYPFDLAAIRELHTIELKPVTFFVGENGTGKSTLLEAIAVGLRLNAEGGSRNFNFSTRASHSVLHEYLTLGRSHGRVRDCWFLRAESFFNVASEIERLEATSYGTRNLHEQSHGESFWALFTHRFGAHGLYLLDEPEAALSPARQLAFLCRLHELVRAGSQFVIATHSPIIMAYPDASIYLFSERGVELTPYQETEHFRVTRDFLACPERSLRVLFEDTP